MVRGGLLGELDTATAALDRILNRMEQVKSGEKAGDMRGLLIEAQSLQSKVNEIILAIQRLSN